GNFNFLNPKGMKLFQEMDVLNSLMVQISYSFKSQLLSSSTSRPTIHHMIIHHTRSLHVGVDYGCAYKFETALF
ncbi:MAG: hypothetical protein RL607_614, partial [Bacteroidota bacterium]